jgi:hypothetical protein
MLETGAPALTRSKEARPSTTTVVAEELLAIATPRHGTAPVLWIDNRYE